MNFTGKKRSDLSLRRLHSSRHRIYYYNVEFREHTHTYTQICAPCELTGLNLHLIAPRYFKIMLRADKYVRSDGIKLRQYGQLCTARNKIFIPPPLSLPSPPPFLCLSYRASGAILLRLVQRNRSSERRRRERQFPRFSRAIFLQLRRI